MKFMNIRWGFAMVMCIDIEMILRTIEDAYIDVIKSGTKARNPTRELLII